MPKSDTWPGGVGLETMNGMDSAGSCDSVVSANSGFSDDSLEHLSAEEKACLMFLEETIESLDTEEDSGLSNDEPDQLPCPGNLATKLADLSASMSKSKLSSPQKPASKEPTKEIFDAMHLQSYLVPTPFVVANSSPCSLLNTKPGVPPDKNHRSKSHFTPSSNKPDPKRDQKPAAPQVPCEVNVVIPPPTKPRDFSVGTPEGLPRGPLSYEALVHLRRSASTKKTPLCPKIDHTIDLEKHLPITEEGPNFGNLQRSDRSHLEGSRPKPAPPVVAPKPKMIPANIPVRTQDKAAKSSDSSYSIKNDIPVKTQVKASKSSDSLYNIKNAKDPKVVRLEALQKLGLLKDPETENDTLAPLSPPKSQSFLGPTHNGHTRGPSNANPSRSPSFCHSQVPTEPKIKPLQSSASFHHYSRRDQQPVSASHPAQSNGFKAAGLERSATLDNHRNGANSQPAPQKPSNSVGYTVMVVPGMGADRKEALRKLGLLKD